MARTFQEDATASLDNRRCLLLVANNVWMFCCVKKTEKFTHLAKEFNLNKSAIYIVFKNMADILKCITATGLE